MEHYSKHLIAGIPTTKGDAENARSRVGAKRKRVSHEGPQDIPWTASRCNRLLRTITSRISILQRLAASNRLHLTPEGKARVATAARHPASDPTLVTPSKDPEWLPVSKEASKAGLKTYARATKGKRDREKADAMTGVTVDQPLGLPTPFVKRMLGHEPLSEYSQSDDSMSEFPMRTTKLPHARSRRVKLPVLATSLAEEANRNLVTALESFLIATQPVSPRLRIGASSLISSCLRKVPEYIQLEADAVGEENGMNDNAAERVTNEVYAELEGRGSGSSGGWPGLREVVRADGIERICDAIQDGLLAHRTIDGLIVVCSKCAAPKEAQALIHAKLFRGKPRESGKLLDHLYDTGAGGDTDGFRLRIARVLLEDDRVTVVDVLEQRTLCQSITRSLARLGDLFEAAALLQTCCKAIRTRGRGVEPLTERGQHTIRMILERIAVILAAVASTRRGEHCNDKMLRGVAHVVHSLAAQTCMHSVDENECSRVVLEAAMVEDMSYAVPFLLGSLSLISNGNCPAQNMQHPTMHELTTTIQRVRDSEVGDKAKRRYQLSGDDFLSQIATCFGRSLPEAGHSFLRTATLQLLHLATAASQRDAELLQSLALNNAASYIEAVHEKASVSIAEDIEALVTQEIPPIGRTPKRTPRPKQSRPEKYRWEDGLCEWILKTPLLPTAVTHEAEPSQATAGAAALRQATPEGKRDKKQPCSGFTGEQFCQPLRAKKAIRPGHAGIAWISKVAMGSSAIGVESDSDGDELALSVKKPKRSSKVTCSHEPSVAEFIRMRDKKEMRGGQAYTRPSSGSWTSGGDCSSDDELMGL